MKKQIIYSVVLLSFFTIFISNCKKEKTTPKPKELSEVITDSVTSISQDYAQCGGNVIYDGGGLVYTRGVCWSTSNPPSHEDYKSIDGGGLGKYKSSITNLNKNTVYYVRAYATGDAGTNYGNVITFKTNDSPGLPVLQTDSVSDITQTSAITGGRVNSDGGSQVIARGVCWSKSPNPTITNYKTIDGNGIGSFISSLVNLKEKTTYYIRSYATNSIGTNYGNEMIFTTLAKPVAPTLTTNTITNLGESTATCGGNISSDGGATITARGTCWSLNINPTIGDFKTNDGMGMGSFSSSLTGLSSNTTYNVRAYAINSVGVSYGNNVTFTTKAPSGNSPTVTTDLVNIIGLDFANCGGNVTSSGTTTVIERGLCWSTSNNPTISNSKSVSGSGTGTFISSLTGLSPNTKYYVRAYATNSNGTGYGSEMSLTSITVKDYDGNVYSTITIGSQTWMVENLKTSKYNNGDAIPVVADNTQWSNLTTGATDYSNNNSGNLSDYGRVYNHYAVMDSRGVCPVGWHLPSDTEWGTLMTSLGGMSPAGGKMKQTGTTYWNSPNNYATNSSYFTGVASGFRAPDGTFMHFGMSHYMWSVTTQSSTNATAWYLYYTYGDVKNGSYSKKQGFSVRCLK